MTPTSAIYTLSLHDALPISLATLADRSALRVTVSVELDERLPPAVESAAYFVAAEAIANAGKHSGADRDRKSTRLNSSHLGISYAVFCLKKKKDTQNHAKSS